MKTSKRPAVRLPVIPACETSLTGSANNRNINGWFDADNYFARCYMVHIL
jgi:hypothetical protein